MAKDDPPGLLSKVVKFVRNPTVNWNDLDNADLDRESTYSKQMLKDMIERRRRNDFVRKREFDMLRKIRARGVVSAPDGSARPSFFQSSLQSKPDDRATTLKKIDEIEAQMSQQWWKTKNGTVATRTGDSSFPVSTQPDSRGSDFPSAIADESQSYARTEVAPLDARPAGGFSATQTQPMPAAPLPAGKVTSFSASNMLAVEVDESAHDPELEEAAIRFANGDDEGAEAGLMDALSPAGQRANHVETWLTLFDLYRATANHDRFESAAIDFANRFGRSAPLWFSMPDMVKGMKEPAASASPAHQTANWAAPSIAGLQTVATLEAILGRVAQPWCLDWRTLRQVEDEAVEPMRRLFSNWASRPVRLRFIGADQLLAVLKAAAPSSDKSVNPDRWRLRMEVLRVMHEADEFEMAALEYCITYEVSPPSWERANCEFKTLDEEGSSMGVPTVIGEPQFGDVNSGSTISGQTMGYGDTQVGAPDMPAPHISSVELAGQISGDAAATLQTLDERLTGADLMVVSCAKLIRVDFSAAGALLNWVTARQTEGRLVQFSEVHRLVAAFFHVIGINEHARVLVRHE